MLPARLRYWLFDTLSVQTMRYVSAVPTRRAKGLTKAVYDMIREDFFKNGSLTSRSKVPELMAAIWTGGRESMLVADKVDRTTKDAVSAVLSQINDCPYCEDMLISLVHAGGDHEAANDIFVGDSFDASDELLRKRLEWVRAIATDCRHEPEETPFTAEQLPEVIGTLMGMSDINRFSHVVMEDSPVPAPFGLRAVKALALRMFGRELEVTRSVPLVPGRALGLLPPAELPDDMLWALPNPRIADAVARWAAAVEKEGAKVISPPVRQVVTRELHGWRGEQMPLDGSWIDSAVTGLSGEDRAIARLAIMIAKASYRVTDKMVADVLGEKRDEERLIRILAWSSFTAARNFARIVAERIAVAADESDIRAVAQLQTLIKSDASRTEEYAQVRYA
jgi:AhpD family alkylhydroperoxidase